ncbi:MAG: ChaN family lipoprotein [Lentimicrobium sp.]|nr:ChaN family lipoprotein [Lentimicrobium sp.]
MKRILSMGLLFVILTAMRGDLPAYKLYNAKGKSTDFNKLVSASMDADVVLFGELHNNPISHWLQLELSKALFEKKPGNFIMGAEMFEADNSLIIYEYLQKKVNDRSFEAEARLWPNYKTDYKPLLVFARDNKIPFIATNIPRRYASLVNREGFEGLQSLTDEAGKYIAPLPIVYDAELPGYKSMIEMMGGAGGHVNDNLPKAQAIKDATMAHFILQNLKSGSTFLHFHGTYHSDNYEGIVWYLKQQRPDLKIVTINSSEQDTISRLDDKNQNKADFILAVPSSMTKTH